jgi:very-short-patch-repair endonuclease
MKRSARDDVTVAVMRVPDRDAPRTARRRLARRRLAEHLAEQQAGVLSRPQAYAAGITRYEVRANVVARRWRTVGKQSLATYTGPLADRSREWVAVFEAGPRGFLDGASSLKAAGLKNFDVDRIRVSVPRGARVRRAKGIDIRQTRRWAVDDLAPGPGVPRSRNEVAAIRGALWAVSDKQAALILAMTVQQGLARPQQLGEQMLRIRRDRRRLFLNSVVLDLLGGVRSLSELDVARECRRRGLPEPTRQVVRRGKNGTYYLDLVWDEWGLVVEVDGIHHSWAQNVVSDALRQNDVTLQGARVLRMPILGLRVAADDFFGQIEDALVAAGCPIGWSRPA